MKKIIPVLLALLVIGCAGRFTYDEPLLVARGADTYTSKYPMQQTWAAALTGLKDEPLMMANRDDVNRVLDLRYTGDMEEFIDCGWIHAYVLSDRGGRHYKFPASRAEQSYETMTTDGSINIVNRKLDLVADIRLAFVPGAGNTTKVTSSVHYKIIRSKVIRGQGVGGLLESENTIEFNSDGRGTFEPDHMEEATTCSPTGNLEQYPLSVMRRYLTD